MIRGRPRRPSMPPTPWRGALIAMCFLALLSPLSGAAAMEDDGFLERYCLECHDVYQWAGGLALDVLSWDQMRDDGEIWENVVRKLRGRMMPPADHPRPADDELNRFVADVESVLDAEVGTWVGSSGLRRLTRFEYANAVRDLLALDGGVEDLLPPDVAASGFDTRVEAQASSPRLMEAYVSAPVRLSRRAVGDPQQGPAPRDNRPPAGWSQDRHIEGMPLGTRGGFVVRHEFPADGEYEFQIATASGTLFGNALPRGTTLYASVDGVPVEAEDLRNFRLQVEAGPRLIQVAMVDRVQTRGTDDIYSIPNLLGAVAGVSVIGPFEPAGVGDTPSRRRVFVCTPRAVDEEEPCARAILSRLATQAYRRPVAGNDPQVEALMRDYRAGREAGQFDDGIREAIARVLVNPRFLFRLETSPADARPGVPFRVPDIELASRLSFFLWSRGPDEELLAVAAAGRLQHPDELERQVRRMLADPRAEALATNFAGQWLNLRALDAVPVDEENLDENLKEAFLAETRLFVESIVREDRSVLDLVTADYTFLNEPLARHYGIAGVRGSYMRRVDLSGDTARRGMLGHASILTLTSVVDRTSPVIRGKWILETVLGAHVPPPPPGVETDLAPETGGSVPASLRERLEIHRDDPACRSCHQIIDPLGFALENFDRIGRWRTVDAGLPVDARGQLADGTPLTGIADLSGWIAAHPEVLVTNVVERMLIYALGRSIDHRDMPVVRSIVNAAAERDHRFSDLVLEVVRSRPFLWRVIEDDEAITAAVALKPKESPQ